MKHAIFVTLLLYCNFAHSALSDSTPKQPHQFNVLMYEWPENFSFWYTAGRELLYMVLMGPFVTNSQASQETAVYCNKCNYARNIHKTYSICIFNEAQFFIKKIRSLIYRGNQEKIASFLLKFHEHFQIECELCKTYQGWHTNDSHGHQASV